MGLSPVPCWDLRLIPPVEGFPRIGRVRQLVILTLLLLEVAGARAYTLPPGAGDRGDGAAYFGPSPGFEILARTLISDRSAASVTPTLGPTSLAPVPQTSPPDLARADEIMKAASAGPLGPAAGKTLPTALPDPGGDARPPCLLRRLPTDLLPVQPAHLESKK